jgi:hypothetical protein
MLPSDVNFIQKPFSPRVIAQKIRAILDGARTGS